MLVNRLADIVTTMPTLRRIHEYSLLRRGFKMGPF